MADTASTDEWARVAARLDLPTFVHVVNSGYERNQKRQHGKALRLGAGIAVMLHPDY